MSILDIAVNQGALTARRYGIDVPVRRHLVLIAGVLIVGSGAITAGAAGYLVGERRRLDGSSLTTEGLLVLSTLAAVVLILAAAAPTRRLVGALQSLRSWHLPASCGVSVRSFVWGRYLLVEVTKAGAISVWFATFLTALLVAEGSPAPSWTLLAPALSSCVALTALRCTWILRSTTRRLRPAPPQLWRRATAVTLLSCGTVAALLAAWPRRGSALEDTIEAIGREFAQHGIVTVAGAMATLLASVAWALKWHSALGRLDWADAWEQVLAARTARVSAPTLPSGALAAVCSADARRLSRSRSERLRPVLSVVIGLPLLLLIAGFGLALGDVDLQFPSETPRLPLLAGLVAVIGYSVSVACASILAMDADRHALTLWRSTPRGLRTVAAARAMQGALLTALTCGAATVAATLAFDLAAWESWVCLVAGATMAVFGPPIDLVASLLWPNVEWTSTTEIGTSSPGRYAASFLVGIPVAGVLAVLIPLEVEVPVAAVVLSGVLFLVLAPVLAGAWISAVVHLGARRLHA